MPTTVHGTAIRPVVSRNGRQYTTEMLRKAHARLAARLADPAGDPVTMRTFHPDAAVGAGASTEAIAGRLTAATLQPDGSITYEGVLADTDAGKTVAKLATPDETGRQHLANVSIRGYLLGDLAKTSEGYTTADDLEIVGLDFTDTPGVPGASATAAREAADAATTETAGRTLIYESAETAIVTDSTDPVPPAVVSPLAGETAPVPAEVEAFLEAIAEAYVSMDMGHGGHSVHTSSYGADPSKMKDLVGKHAAAAQAAMKALGMGEDVSTSVGWESAPATPAVPAPEATASPTTKEAPVADTTPATEASTATTAEPTVPAATPAAETAPAADTAIAESIQRAIAAGIAEGIAAAKAEPAPVAETAEARAAREAAELRESVRAELIAEMRSEGNITRKGLVRVAESDFDFSKLSQAEKDKVAGDSLVAQLFPQFLAQD